MQKQITTLSKLIELFSADDSFESIESVVKGARFLQKSFELLNITEEIPESRLLEVSKRFNDKGIRVEGDLLLPNNSSNFDAESLNVKVNTFSSGAAVTA
jgi:hypothetical protein